MAIIEVTQTKMVCDICGDTITAEPEATFVDYQNKEGQKAQGEHVCTNCWFSLPSCGVCNCLIQGGTEFEDNALDGLLCNECAKHLRDKINSHLGRMPE